MSLSSRLAAVVKNKFISKVRRPQLTNIALCQKIIDNIDLSIYKPNETTLIDMNPGLGVFSQVLNERIKPARHILLEPAKSYWPTLEEFVKAAPGTELVEADGHDWATYAQLFGEGLEQLPTLDFGQRVMPENWRPLEIPTVPPENGLNPNLLFVGNITDLSYARRLLTQFIVTASPAGGWIQRFGRARFLLWVREEDCDRHFPKVMQSRMRSSVITDTLHDVTEHTESKQRTGKGHPGMIAEKHSLLGKQRFETGLERVLRKQEKVMEKQLRYSMTSRGQANREKYLLKETPLICNGLQILRQYIEGNTYPLLDPAKIREMDFFQLTELTKEISQNPPKHFVSPVEKSYGDESLDLTASELSSIPGAYHATEEEMERFREYEQSHLQFHQICRVARSIPDERYALSLDPPLLQAWRETPGIKPVPVDKKDFVPPKMRLSLLEFRPKVLHPYFQESSGDLGIARWRLYEWLVQQLFTTRAQTVKNALSQIAPGAASMLEHLPEKERKEIGARRVRVLTTDELVKLAECWEEWDFKPEEMKWGDLGAAEAIMLAEGTELAWKMKKIDGKNKL